PHQSGIKTTFSHVWNEKGSYVINAKAKNSDDIETGWSTLEITMPKNKLHGYFLFQRFLQNHSHLYKILMQTL
ncbi:MAG: hypothetical protein DRN27_06195, partial [Thermoplasmata archaeon]